MRLFLIWTACLIATLAGAAYIETGRTIERTYYEDGRTKTEQEFVNGVAVASPTFYYPNGRVQQEAIPVGDFAGQIRTYYDTGHVQTVTTYKKGKKDGYMRAYYDNGQLQQEFYYTEGRLTHAGRQYYASGKLAADAEPVTGLMNRYDEQTGRIIEKVPFIEGKKEGVRLFYDVQGKQTGFQTCQNNVCGAHTDLTNSPWYRYLFPNMHASFWLVRSLNSIIQASQAFVQERSLSGLVKWQQMTSDNPQIQISYAYNTENLLDKVTILFPVEGVRALVEKEYTYMPRTIIWKLNGIPVWRRYWDGAGVRKDESLNKARVTETENDRSKTRRLLIQSPDATCPVYISFVMDARDVIKTEDAGLVYWNKQTSDTIRRSVTWALLPDERVSFIYFQLPEQYVRIQYAYGIAARMIGESWLETNTQGQTTQFDMSYMFNESGRLSGQTLSTYDKDQPFHQNSLWDTIRQNYEDMPVAAEADIRK